MSNSTTFVEAVEEFLGEATWLDAGDAPMVIALKKCAEELDTKGVQAALLNTFGVTYRTLAKRAPGGVEEDPLAALLDG